MDLNGKMVDADKVNDNGFGCSCFAFRALQLFLPKKRTVVIYYVFPFKLFAVWKKPSKGGWFIELFTVISSVKSRFPNSSLRENRKLPWTLDTLPVLPFSTRCLFLSSSMSFYPVSGKASMVLLVCVINAAVLSPQGNSTLLAQLLLSNGQMMGETHTA